MGELSVAMLDALMVSMLVAWKVYGWGEMRVVETAALLVALSAAE